MSCARALLVSLLSLLPITAAPRPARAQPAGAGAEGTLSLLTIGEGPFNKEAAKAWFAAEQASLPDVKRAVLTAARKLFEARYQDFLSGRDSVDSTVAAWNHVLDADQFVDEGAVARWTVIEGRWRAAWEVERMLRRYFQGGRGLARDYLNARLKRLGAEAELVRSGRAAEQSSALFSHCLSEAAEMGERPSGRSSWWPRRRSPFDQGEVGERGPIEAKELARARFEARGAKRPELARERVEVARELVELRHGWDEHLRTGGVEAIVVDTIFDVVVELLEAEQAEDNSPTRRRALREGRWRAAWERERQERRSSKAGAIAAADYFVARITRLQAALVGAGAGQSNVLLWGYLPDPNESLLDAKELARARFEASQVTAREVAKARLEAAQGALQDWRRDFWERGRLWPAWKRGEGWVTIDVVLEGIALVVAAEAALDGRPEAQQHSREAQWRLAWEAERFNVPRRKPARPGTEPASPKPGDYAYREYLRRLEELSLAKARSPKKKAP